MINDDNATNNKVKMFFHCYLLIFFLTFYNDESPTFFWNLILLHRDLIFFVTFTYRVRNFDSFKDYRAFKHLITFLFTNVKYEDLNIEVFNDLSVEMDFFFTFFSNFL